MILYLNMEYLAGRTTTATKIPSKLTAVLTPPQARPARALGVLAVKFVCASPGRAPTIDLERQRKDLSHSYSGDVVKTAQALTWRQREPALPPRAACGRAPIHGANWRCQEPGPRAWSSRCPRRAPLGGFALSTILTSWRSEFAAETRGKFVAKNPDLDDLDAHLTVER